MAAAANSPAAATAANAASGSSKVVTLHLHTFVYGKLAKKRAAANGSDGSSNGPVAAANGSSGSSVSHDAFSTALGSAEAALMAAVVGTDEALAALPGGPVVAAGMKGGPLSKLCFGVLLWEPLPAADLMHWPVWIEKQLYVVSVVWWCGWVGCMEFS